MKNKGFTLPELLAVIVITGLLVTIAGVNIANVMNNSKRQTNEMILKNAEDAALTYALNSAFISNDCAVSNVINDSNVSTEFTDSSCKKEVSIEALIKGGYFKDDAKKLKTDGKVVIYKLKVGKKTTPECSSSTAIDCFNIQTQAFASSSLLK